MRTCGFDLLGLWVQTGKQMDANEQPTQPSPEQPFGFSIQGELGFDQPAHRQQAARLDGLSAWHRDRALAIRKLAEQFGLPLEHETEVRLKDGVVLRGILRLQDLLLYPEE